MPTLKQQRDLLAEQLKRTLQPEVLNAGHQVAERLADIYLGIDSGGTFFGAVSGFGPGAYVNETFGGLKGLANYLVEGGKIQTSQTSAGGGKTRPVLAPAQPIAGAREAYFGPQTRTLADVQRPSGQITAPVSSSASRFTVNPNRNLPPLTSFDIGGVAGASRSFGTQPLQTRTLETVDDMQSNNQFITIDGIQYRLGSSEATQALLEQGDILGKRASELSGRPYSPVLGQNAPQGQLGPSGGVPGGDGGGLTQITIGDQTYNITSKEAELLNEYKSYLEKTKQIINPNAILTPEKIAEFTAVAEKEINPFFQTQSKLARETLLRDTGYNISQIGQFEQNLETKYGRDVRKLGEQAAETGFALSGIRQRQEQELATDTQRELEAKRRELGFTAGTTTRTFAQKYGGVLGEGFPSIPTIGEAPRVLSGQGAFERGTRQLPFYELSPEIYQGLIGEQEFARRGDIESRTELRKKAFLQERSLPL